MEYKQWTPATCGIARQDQLDLVAKKIMEKGMHRLSGSQFRQVCRHCGVNPDRLTDSDVDAIQDRLLTRKK
jgi:hypothetical protein